MSIASHQPVHESTNSNQTLREAQQLLASLVEFLVGEHEQLVHFANRAIAEAGVRIMDIVDHVGVTEGFHWQDDSIENALNLAGFECVANETNEAWFQFPGANLPHVVVRKSSKMRLALRVESLSDFASANHIATTIQGQPGDRFRKLLWFQRFDFECWVCARQGWLGWQLPDTDPETIIAARGIYEEFLLRRRNFDRDVQGFSFADRMQKKANRSIDRDWLCHLFIAAEREYWERRNYAAQVQRQLQNKLGIGWSNCERMVYRCSRDLLQPMLAWLEHLQLRPLDVRCDAEADVSVLTLGNENCGVLVSIEADLGPDELTNGLPRVELASPEKLGTVDLWCQLNGESFLQSGLARLECRADCDRAESMLLGKFIDLDDSSRLDDQRRSLTTSGQRWTALEYRVNQALKASKLDPDAAGDYLANGSMGSQLRFVDSA